MCDFRPMRSDITPKRNAAHRKMTQESSHRSRRLILIHGSRSLVRCGHFWYKITCKIISQNNNNFLADNFASYFVSEMTTADLRSGPVYQNQSSWPMWRLLSHSAMCCVSFRSDVAPHRPKIAHFSLLFGRYFWRLFCTRNDHSGPKIPSRVSESIVLTYGKTLESFCDVLRLVSDWCRSS
jgi:hypothetical protein